MKLQKETRTIIAIVLLIIVELLLLFYIVDYEETKQIPKEFRK